MDNNKYQRAKLYKIVCNETGMIYIGSTCEPYLSKRLSGHKSMYKRYLNGSTKYITSYKILEKNNYYIELIESIPCNNINEIRKIEGECIKKYGNNCVNKVIPGITRQESSDKYELKNKEMRLTSRKAIRYKNKNIINCECGGRYNIGVSCNNSISHFKTKKHIKYLELKNK